MVCFSLVISNQCGQTKNTISSKKKCLFGGNFFYECCTYRLVPTPLMRNIYINHLTNKTWLSPPSRLPSTQCVHGAQSSSSPRKVELPPFSSAPPLLMIKTDPLGPSGRPWGRRWRSGTDHRRQVDVFQGQAVQGGPDLQVQDCQGRQVPTWTISFQGKGGTF